MTAVIKRSILRIGIAAAVSLVCSAGVLAADGQDPAQLGPIVDQVIRPLMAANKIPGMAVAVTLGGRHAVFTYGLASRESGARVADDTLFEIGSVSKTFTAALGGMAQARGALSLADTASRYLPALAGSSFDRISLLDLATYTAGGLPLQFPDAVRGEDGIIAYFKAWRSAYPAGTQRLYSNPSIGLFGDLAARSMGGSFEDLMEKQLFPALGLASTFIRVPQDQMGRYAFGYTGAGKPVRVGPGALASQAYGVKTTAGDLIRFVEANMDDAGLDDTLRRGLAATHTGYFRVGAMTQGLGWEMYAYPTSLDRLLAGNSSEMARKPQAVTRLDPPAPPRADVLMNKTGSTNGFGTYVAFVPERRLGIVLLANRNYPIPARVEAGYRILTALDKEAEGD